MGKDEEELRQDLSGQEERENLTEAGRGQKTSAGPRFVLKHFPSLCVFFFYYLARSVSFLLLQQRMFHVLLGREGHDHGLLEASP